jgi:hypothetical protein
MVEQFAPVLSTNSWAFNWDVVIGYAYGSFTTWAFMRERWRTLTAVSVVLLFCLAADVGRIS